MTVQEIITAVRTALDEDTAETWSDAQIFDLIQRADDEFYNELLGYNCWILRKTKSYTLVGDQAEYRLPTDFLRVIRITDTSYTPELPIPLVDASMDLHYETYGSPPWRAYLRAPYFALAPAPAAAATDRVKLYYAPIPARMTTGTAAAAATGTITLATTATLGATSAEDDYYNDRMVVIHSGTGIGQKRLASDYVGSTRVLTPSDEWSTAPTSGVYCIMPVTPEAAHEVLVSRVCEKCCYRSRDPAAAVFKQDWFEERETALARLKKQFGPLSRRIRRKYRYSF